MLSTEEYILGWGLYVLGALGLMVVWWRITRKLRPVLLRNVLRLSAAVALLVPYPVPNFEILLAPALITTFLEGLFYDEYGFARAGMPLVLAVVMVNILYLVIDLAWQSYRRKHRGAQGADNDEPSTSGEEPEDERKEPRISV